MEFWGAAGLGQSQQSTERTNRFRRAIFPLSILRPSAAIHEDRDGTLWIGTGGGLDRFVPGPQAGTFTHLRHDLADPTSLSHDFVRTLYEDRDGILWIGTRRGLNRVATDRLDPTTLSLTPYLPSPEQGAVNYNSIGSIHQDRRGRLWLGTWNGLMRFDPDASPTFVFYGDDSNAFGDPMLDSIWDIHEDRHGTLWLATYGTGILRFDPVTETFLAPIDHDPLRPTSLSGNKVTAFLQDRSGAFWVGTSGNGLNKLGGPPAKPSSTTGAIQRRLRASLTT